MMRMRGGLNNGGLFMRHRGELMIVERMQYRVGVTNVVMVLNSKMFIAYLLLIPE